MARGNIQRVRIHVDSQGSERVQGELKDINKEIENIGKNTERTSAILTTVNSRASVLARTLQSVATAGRSMGEALNGNTQESTRRLSAYIENIDILVLSMKELRREATETADALNRVGGGNTDNQIRLVNENLGHLINELTELNNTSRRSEDNLTSMNSELRRLESRSETSENSLEGLNNSIDSLSSALTRTRGPSTRFNRQLLGFQRSGNSAIRTFSKMVFGMNPLVQTYAAIAVNVYAASEAFRVLNEAANFDRLEQSTADFSAALSGINVKSLALDLQEASVGAMTLRDSMNLATRGTAYKFTTEQLTELTNATRKASIALGRDFSDSIDRAMRGISKQEIEILDEIGVITKLTTAFEKYVAGTDRSVDSLNEAERQTALYNETLGQLKDKFGGIEIRASEWERLGVAFQDLANSSLVALSKTLAPMVSVLADGIKLLTKETSNLDLALDSLKTAEAASEAGNLGQAIVATAEAERLLAADASEANATLAEHEELMSTINSVMETTLPILAGVAAAYALYKLRLIAITVQSNIAALSIIRVNRAMYAQGVAAAAASGRIGILVGITKALGASVRLLSRFIMANPIGLLLTGVAALATWWFFDEDDSASIDKNTEAINKQSEAVHHLWTQKQNLRDLGLTGDISEEEGKRILAYLDGLKKTNTAISDIRVGFMSVKGPFDDYITKVKELNNFDPIAIASKNKGVLVATAKEFEEFTGSMDLSIDGMLDVRADLLESLSRVNSSGQVDPEGNVADLATNLEAAGFFTAKLLKKAEEARDAFDNMPGLLAGIDANPALTALEKSTKKAEVLKNTQLAIQDVNDKITDSVHKTLLKEELKLETLKKVSALKTSIADLDTNTSLALIKLQANHNEFKSKELELQLANLEAKKALTNQTSEELAKLERKTKVLEAQIALQKQLEAEKAARDAVELSTATGVSGLERKEAVAPNDTARFDIQSQILDLKEKEILANERGHEQAMALLDIENQRKDIASQRLISTAQGVSSLMSHVSNLDGLSTMHTSLLGIAGTSADVTASFQAFEEQNKGAGFFDWFTSDAETFMQTTGQITNAVGSMYQSMASAKIAGIDAEIAAEKKRDGKSAESVAKIKKLQAKKIKEEARAKKVSVIMSTATGIMQGYAQLGPIGGTAFAAAMLAISAMQMSAIDKAASGQLSSSSGGLGLSAGKRDNTVDVSKSANAGEAAYLSGARGSGSDANNFTPGRAGGGMVNAGTSVVVGERGPEIITPSIDVGVTAPGSGGTGSSVTFAPVINANMVDGSGFEELATTFNEELFNGLEVYLNANGKTLQSL